MRETVKAARLLDRAGPMPKAADEIAGILAQPSPITRRRIAAKILQRLRAGAQDAALEQSFIHLLANTDDSEARRELVTYAATVSDPIVGAIASDVLYPFFIEGVLPQGTRPDEASPQREGLLLTVEPALTLRFIVAYAEKRWGYRSARSIRLAMRILHRGGIVLPQRLRSTSRRLSGYVLAPHGISLTAFVWCFIVEFPPSTPPPAEAAIAGARFVRNLVVPPAVVHARLMQAEREGLLRTQGAGGRRISAALSPEETIERLLRR